MFFAIFFSLLLASIAFASPISESSLDKRADTTTYNNLVFYLKYASSVYNTACTKPNGNTLITTLNDVATDTQGFIVRDDTRKEIVAVFRGSGSATDFLTDSSILLVPFTSSGVSAPTGVLVHTGFLTAYNSVASKVISTIKSELAAHPGYKLVTSGHSLGGALSSVAAVSIKSNFPSSTVNMYTYGQPRTGNPAYASFANSLFPAGTAFRSVHTTDGVPTIIPTYYGYQHHATEYWSYVDPVTAATTKQCSGNEDLTCSASIISGGINAPHLTYFNIYLSTAYCT